jgi:hypothetical protein
MKKHTEYVFLFLLFWFKFKNVIRGQKERKRSKDWIWVGEKENVLNFLGKHLQRRSLRIWEIGEGEWVQITFTCTKRKYIFIGNWCPPPMNLNLFFEFWIKQQTNLRDFSLLAYGELNEISLYRYLETGFPFLIAFKLNIKMNLY